jgi:predicted aminopeptidase
VRRWLAAHGDDSQRAAYAAFAQRREDFLALLLAHRRRLAEVYASARPADDKRAAKSAILSDLQHEYLRVRHERWGGFAGYDRFFNQTLTGAHLAAVGAYNDWVPAFESLLAAAGGDLPAFYAQVRQLGALDKDARTVALNRLAPRLAQVH